MAPEDQTPIRRAVERRNRDLDPQLVGRGKDDGESFFVRHAYSLGANDPCRSLKTSLKAEVDREAWETLHSDTSRPFPRPSSGRIAVKVINRLGDEVMKVLRIPPSSGEG